jgi:hypothetical protein
MKGLGFFDLLRLISARKKKKSRQTSDRPRISFTGHHPKTISRNEVNSQLDATLRR